MMKNKKLEKPWIYEEDFETPITLKPRYGYGLRFLELWFPKNMDLETIKYYVKYIGNYLAKHGISSYATIYKPDIIYRRVLFSLHYPKGVRGLNNIVIDIMKKLGTKKIYSKYSEPTLYGNKILYEV